ncbi:unnamed protein product [Enterobius vermicularis]|uniref:DNA-directed RNA polymerase n=1 Tax=Enterobius vermicularis TaxID=51028 RepID=A0A0N4VFG6_ENTVE|nr:unnamed protein product [Enterobius vermicularis]
MIVSDLAAERKDDSLQFWSKLDKEAAISELIRYAVNEEYSRLVAFGMSFTGLKEKRTTQFQGSDEFVFKFFAAVLLLAARGIKNYTAQGLVDQAASVSLFYSTATFLERLELKGDKVRSAALIVLDRMEKWTDLRSIDERSMDIDKLFEGLQNTVKEKASFRIFCEYLCSNDYSLNFCSCFLIESFFQLVDWGPKKDRFFMNNDDHDVIVGKLGSMYGNMHIAQPPEDYYKYPSTSKLVAELNFPATTTEYRGSPFTCSGLCETDYLKKFKEQQAVEASHLLRVRNFCRKSKKISAEKLLEQWGWQKSLEVLISKKVTELRHFSLRSYLESLDPAKCASLVYSSVITACASGQQYIVFSQLIHMLASPILDFFYNTFVQRLGIRKDEVLEEVFLRYVQYFLDQNIARKCTLREWWMHCCSRTGVNPELAPPFADLHFELRGELGSFLLSLVVKACCFPKRLENGTVVMKPAFAIRDVSLEQEDVFVESYKADLVKMVRIDPALMDLFLEHQFEWLFFPVTLLPMTAPPRPWIDHGRGGPSYNRPSDAFRILEEYRRFDTNSEVKKRFQTRCFFQFIVACGREEIFALFRSQARPVFDALNDLGTTPWKINKETLSVLKEVFNMCGDASKEKFLSNLSVPLRADTVDIPDYVMTFGRNKRVEDLPKEKWIEFSKAKYQAVKRRGELNSLWYWMMYRIAVAESWKDEILYFPHNMDFRGRVYPISPYLSHMGDDINRSLLLFAKGKPLGPKGLQWLKLHCINLTGKKKRESINARLKYAEEMLPKMLDSANNPLGGEQWWMESDDPWQTLAACIEVRNALKHVYHLGDHEKYISHFPVHQDGTCNGLQHYAALGRDTEGAKEVNLLPCDVPSDVYSGVAQRVEQKRLNDEKSPNQSVREVALALREAMPQPVPRKVIKQTVMTTVYGVTMYGGVQQIKRQLKGLDISTEKCVSFASYLTQKTFSSLDEAFANSMKIKDWFRSCASAIARQLLRSVEWVTPLGLPVVQPYLTMETKLGRLVFLPVPIKQINAFPPNFVHSLDSTHMMLTALNCRRLGLTFAAVHDCYWTHACTVDSMNKICRDQFIKLHSLPLVEECGKVFSSFNVHCRLIFTFFISKYLGAKVGKTMPPQKYSEFKNIFEPKFVFGDLDIEEVRKSVYFFS